MCKVTMEMTTPAGVPVTIEFEAGDDAKVKLFNAMNLAAAATEHFVSNGWRGPGPGPDADSTFGGYRCSPAVNAAGFPSYIILDDGRRADRHSKQNDTWYSVKNEDGTYEQVIRFGAGDVPRAPVAPSAVPQAPVAPSAVPQAPYGTPPALQGRPAIQAAQFPTG